MEFPQTRFFPWAGPALALLGLGLVGLVSLQSPDDRSPLDWWILSNARAYERVLPLIGLGTAMALVSWRQCIAAFVFFTAGIAFGFFDADLYFSAIAPIPGAIEHQFLTGPILSTAVGLSLAVPTQIRRWVLPITAVIAGAMFAVAIRLTDPSLHNPFIARVGIAIGFWIVIAVWLTVLAVRQSWFEMAARIIGSWLIAIGLLYGGASLIPRRELYPPPPQASSSNGLTRPGLDKIFPDLDQSKRQLLPGGFDPSRQP